MFTFTEKQKIVNEKIKKFCGKSNNKFMLLAPAGTGKSTLVIKSLYDMNMNVCFCSFTNRATQNMKNIIYKFKNDSNDKTSIFENIDYKTIHCFLKLQPKIVNMSTKKNKTSKNNIGVENSTIYNFDELKHILTLNEIKKGINISDNSKIQKEIKNVDELLTFRYNYKKLDYVKKYDVVVIDECGTISKELYMYLESTIQYLATEHNHNIKYIFLGDYYQLNPVNENKSIIFNIAKKEKWPISKLYQIIRSKTEHLNIVNKQLLNFINNKVKKRNFNSSLVENPYKIIPHNRQLYIRDQYIFFRKYIEAAVSAEQKEQNVSNDKIIITYSNANCNKTNKTIQSMIDKQNNIIREPDVIYKNPYKSILPMIWFRKKDRLLVQSTINVPNYKIISSEGEDIYVMNENANPDSKSQNEENKIFNGDIFIVKSYKNIKIRTILNTFDSKFQNIIKYFNGQIIFFGNYEEKSINTNKYIIHVDTLELEKIRRILKKKLNHEEYSTIFRIFKQNFSTLNRGYCMTCYKLQGSEFKHVFVNLKSFWACFNINSSTLSTQENTLNAKKLFSSFYTACTRASHELFLYW